MNRENDAMPSVGLKILKSGYIYKPNFRILDNEGSEDETETPKVIS
jgi:hypothetical protein